MPRLSHAFPAGSPPVKKQPSVSVGIGGGGLGDDGAGGGNGIAGGRLGGGGEGGGGVGGGGDGGGMISDGAKGGDGVGTHSHAKLLTGSLIVHSMRYPDALSGASGCSFHMRRSRW